MIRRVKRERGKKRASRLKTTMTPGNAQRKSEISFELTPRDTKLRFARGREDPICFVGTTWSKQMLTEEGIRFRAEEIINHAPLSLYVI